MIEELPLCKCGCGDRVKRKGNKYIHNHHLRDQEFSQEQIAKRVKSTKETKSKPKPIALPCECGCGNLANPGRDYIWGHNQEGKEHSELSRKRSSDSAKNRVYTEEDTARMSENALREKEPLPDDWEIDKTCKMATNKDSGVYLGVVIAETLLVKLFKNVQRMPIGNHGYDFICGNGYKIDSKSSATGDKNGSWQFGIKKNTIADYFICIAWDNRKSFNLTHIWLIPGKDINHLSGILISKSTIHKWTKYEQPIDKYIECCNNMRGN